jgi:hypothetical protein
VELPGTLSGRTRHEVLVLDLSVTGCLARVATAPARGAILDLTVELEGETLAGKVRVTGSYLDGSMAVDAPRRHLCGLEFLALHHAEEARLRRFLDDEKRRRRGADTPLR